MKTLTFPQAIKNDTAYNTGEGSGYLPVLHESVKDVVNMTCAERLANCEVLAFNQDNNYWDAPVRTARFAICRPVAREKWDLIPTGTMIAYTELFRWADKDDDNERAGIVGDYVTHLGPIACYDSKRKVFYAGCLRTSGDNALDYEGEDICEVYVVERFAHVK